MNIVLCNYFISRIGIVGDLVLPNADDICASFQYTATKHLAMRLQRAMEFIELNELLPSTNLQLVRIIIYSHLLFKNYSYFKSAVCILIF